MTEHRTRILFEHYRDTVTLATTLRDERNRFFLYLLIAIAIGILFASDAFAGYPLLDTINRYLEIGLETEALARTLPYQILQALILAAVFFLMMNLYHHSVSVLRYYAYISLLETEVRAPLELADEAVAFTRESGFYWRNRPPLLGLTKYFYALIIGVALGLYMTAKGVGDWNAYQASGERPEAMASLVVDGVIGLPILLVFLGYFTQSIGLDRRPAGKRQ